jgi:hypothetical protein
VPPPPRGCLSQGSGRASCAPSYVASLDRSRIGDHTRHRQPIARRIGRPLSARSKDGYLGALRSFFRDCQEWGWIARRLIPVSTPAEN